MAREIKFRGWHVGLKKMFSAEEMATDQLTLLPTGQFINVSGIATRLSKIYSTDKFIPLQFTGLHDNKRTKEYLKGQEVYEDSLLKVLTGDIFIVEWDVDGWVGRDTTQSGYVIGLEQLLCQTRFAAEVIGNIHENPELVGE